MPMSVADHSGNEAVLCIPPQDHLGNAGILHWSLPGSSVQVMFPKWNPAAMPNVERAKP